MPVKTIVKPRTSYIPTSASVALFPAATKSCALLDQFKPQQTAGIETTALVRGNPAIKRMGAAFAKALEKDGKYDVVYDKCLSLAKRLKCTSKDVSYFAFSMAEHNLHPRFGFCAGLFLSALINASPEKYFTISTHGIGAIDQLGYRNSKFVSVVGDVGPWVGQEMKGGILRIKGNAGRNAGCWMKGGILLILGNAGDFAGNMMDGGTLRIMGNAGQFAAYNIHSGTLEILGNADKNTGCNMHGGEATIAGDVLGIFSERMYGGKISVGGNIGTLSGFDGKPDPLTLNVWGNVFQRGVQLVKYGEIIAQPKNK